MRRASSTSPAAPCRCRSGWPATAARRSPGRQPQNPQTIRLTPLLPKALYLTVYGIGAPFLRDPALDVIEQSKLNALVIDSRATAASFPTRARCRSRPRPGRCKLRTIPDLKALASDAEGQGPLPDRAHRRVQGRPAGRPLRPGLGRAHHGRRLWKDREGLAGSIPSTRRPGTTRWAWPKRPPPLASTRSSSTTCAFPTAVGHRLSRRPRREAIARRGDRGFLREARRRLAPFNVFLAIDMFGYVCWNRNDTGIGQRTRGPGDGGGLYLAHALSVGLPVRHSRLPQSGPESLRDRLQVAGRVQKPDGSARRCDSALAAGVSRLCLRRTGVRRRRDRQADQGVARCRLRRMDAVEPAQCLLVKPPTPGSGRVKAPTRPSTSAAEQQRLRYAAPRSSA